jgi:release factor glutamine methyltransferase
MPENRFAAVLCNPPYITLEERDTLQPEVRDYEPPVALFDEGDGLTFHRRLASVAQDLLLEGGQLIVELGGNAQGQGVLEIFRDAGLDPQLHRDLQGDARTVSGTLASR